LPVTDTDFDVAAWRGDGDALHRPQRIVVRDLPAQETQASDLTGVRAVIAPPARADQMALQQLHMSGVRGLRFRLDTPSDADAILNWAERIVALDWHVEVELPNKDDALRLADAEWALLQVPVATCFSGLGGFLATREDDDADRAFLLELVAMGRFWLKLSGTEFTAAQPPAHDALHRLVNAAMAVREDRLVWGSGPALADEDPTAHLDAAIAALCRLVPGDAPRGRVLWSNPAALYRF
jgi:predicted TIM-barrel fold metal-dependent hydrolase